MENLGEGVEKRAPTLEGGSEKHEPPPRTKGSRVWKHFCWRCRLLNWTPRNQHTHENKDEGWWLWVAGLEYRSLLGRCLHSMSSQFTLCHRFCTPRTYRFCIQQIHHEQTILANGKPRYRGPHEHPLKHSIPAHQMTIAMSFIPSDALCHADVINWIINLTFYYCLCPAAGCQYP